MTQLRKLAKRVGRNHTLALQLWCTDNHDAKIIGLLIDEPNLITREQAEEQVDAVGAGMLAHVFSSCDATLPKTAFAFDMARDWIDSTDAMRRRCGYGLIYELSKNRRDKQLTDAFFLACIARIGEEIGSEENMVRLAMGGALIGIGKRNKALNQTAIRVAEIIGPVEYDGGGPGCEPLDMIKHLTSEYLKNKFGDG